jgi:predicted transcriptional regulator
MLKFVLKETLDNLNITRNFLAVKGEIRPATLGEIYYGTAKRLDIDTLTKIMDTLNSISTNKGKKVYNVTDILTYIPEEIDTTKKEGIRKITVKEPYLSRLKKSKK